MSILKSMRSPTLTLISVANPWIDASPAPSISHSCQGVPGLEFSQTIALASGLQLSVVATAAAGMAKSPDTTSASAEMAAAECRAVPRKFLI